MQPLEINSLLASIERVDTIATAVREFFIGDNASRTHAGLVRYKAAPHDPTGFIAQVLHAKITARLEYARYETADVKLISGQYVFTRKVDDKEVQLPIHLRFVAPNHLIIPGGQICNLQLADSIGQYGNMVWDAVAYALLGEVLDGAEVWA